MSSNASQGAVSTPVLHATNLKIIKGDLLRLFNNFLSKNSGLRGRHIKNKVDICVGKAKRCLRHYAFEEDKISPYKEILALSYFLKIERPYSLYLPQNFAQQIAKNTYMFFEGTKYTAENIGDYIERDVSCHISYWFAISYCQSIQKEYIEEIYGANGIKPDSFKKDALEKAHQANGLRMEHSQKSIYANFKEFKGGPIDFIAMMEGALMIDDYTNNYIHGTTTA